MAFTEKYVSSLASGGGTGNSEGSAYTFDEMKTLINAGTAAGYRFNIKADGTYTRSASDTISGSGTVTAPVILRGYKTVIGDGYLGRLNQGALIRTNMPLISYGSLYSIVISGFYIIIDSISLSFAQYNGPFRLTGQVAVFNSYILNTLTHPSARCVDLSGSTDLNNCDIHTSASNAGGGILIEAYGSIYACRISTDSTYSGYVGISVYEGRFILNSVILSSNGYGIQAAVNPIPIIGNTIYSQNIAAISLPNRSQNKAFLCYNNIITDCAVGITGYNAIAVIDYNNYYRSNTSPNTGFGDWPSYNIVTGTGSPSADFINAPSGDLRLVKTSLATGTALNGGDIGAIQTENKIRLVGMKLA